MAKTLMIQEVAHIYTLMLSYEQADYIQQGDYLTIHARAGGYTHSMVFRLTGPLRIEKISSEFYPN